MLGFPTPLTVRISKTVNETKANSLTDTAKLEVGQHDIFPSSKAFVGWLSVGIVGFACLFLALTSVHIFSPGLQVTDVADHDLYAPEAISVVDRSETAKAIAIAKQTVYPVFQVELSQDQISLESIKASLNRIAQYQALGLIPIGPALLNKTGGKRNSKKSTPAIDSPNAAIILDMLLSTDAIFAEQSEVLPSLKPDLLTRRSIVANLPKTTPLEKAELLTALSVQPTDFPAYQKAIISSAQRLTNKFKRFPVSDKKAWVDMAEEFLPDTMPLALKNVSATILARNLEPNLVIDHKSTQSKAEEVVKSIKPIMRSVAEGELLVPRGAMITSDKLDILQALGITHVNRWPFIFSIGISLVAALTLVALFLYTYEPEHFFSVSSVGLMFTVAVVACAMASIIGKTYPQFVPIPAAALILTIFFGPRVAIVWTVPMIMLIAVDRLVDMRNIFAHCLASAAAIWTYSRQRNAVISTGLAVAAGQVAGDLTVSAFNMSITSWHMLGRQAGIDFLGGISSSILAIGSLPYLENIFGLITPYRLAELTDANQPLLRRLEENAPGTYQHSLAVANLAEAGAKAISADPNMVRAGALYHDIGKMVRPKFFIENQLGATNPHDSMTPEESRARVLAHVTDGIALAQKYALPKAIQDFIPMHQGTTLMAYFYHKACLRDGVEKVDANFYRYPGPKPDTKETAIVMLADVSEAVTHSMQNPTNEEVEIALDKVFQNRWDDGQLADSNLTYEEMQKVRAGFCRVWRTLHHERLKYPATTTGKMPIAPDVVPAETESKAEAESEVPPIDCCSS
ncbi:MAG: HDc protein [Cyanobacteriota bacterium erpe_2018_sw_21hr_WHONDRS-SW48-000092_B_bin.40]|nr:HDc protein [Cyanobacteriota bacterium erpe_2018_sw_21hr_WHONDRS-SW48-000092_B_bin.40]